MPITIAGVACSAPSRDAHRLILILRQTHLQQMPFLHDLVHRGSRGVLFVGPALPIEEKKSFIKTAISQTVGFSEIDLKTNLATVTAESTGRKLYLLDVCGSSDQPSPGDSLRELLAAAESSRMCISLIVVDFRIDLESIIRSVPQEVADFLPRQSYLFEGDQLAYEPSQLCPESTALVSDVFSPHTRNGQLSTGCAALLFEQHIINLRAYLGQVRFDLGLDPKYGS